MEEYRIIKALSGFYYVQTEDGVVECRARGRFRRQDQSPLVGDFVCITRQGDKGVLEELLPRKNAFIRPAVANRRACCSCCRTSGLVSANISLAR